MSRFSPQSALRPRRRTRGLLAAVLVIAAGNAASLAQVAAQPANGQVAPSTAPSASSTVRSSPKRSILKSATARIVRPSAGLTGIANRAKVKATRFKGTQPGTVHVLPPGPTPAPPPVTPPIVGGDPAPVVPPIIVGPPAPPPPAPEVQPPSVPPAPTPEIPPSPSPDSPPAPSPEIPPAPQPENPPAPPPQDPPTPGPEVPPAPSPDVPPAPPPEVPPAPPPEIPPAPPPVDPPPPPPLDPPPPPPTDPNNPPPPPPPDPGDPAPPPPPDPNNPPPPPPDENGDPGTQPQFPILVPGEGFTGPTPQPAPVGRQEMAGYDAKVIARWDVVPYQTFTGDFNVGVVAFHINGVEKVDFSVNGGPWASVSDMKLNPQSGVWEYTATLHASDFTDGQVEVRAIAWPVGAGEPRVLAGPAQVVAGAGNGEVSLPLYANAGGSFPTVSRWVDAAAGSDTDGDGSESSPYATIYKAMVSIRNANGAPYYASFGKVNLKAGSYNYSGRTSYSGNDATTPAGWVTITAAPGVSPSEVVITGSNDISNPKATRTRFSNLTIRSAISSAPGSNPAYWYDSCTLIGSGRTVTTNFSLAQNVPSGLWMTDCEVRDVRSNIYACRLQRNVHVYNIGEQAFFNNGLVVNCTVDGIDKSGTTFHPDIFHLEGGTFNNIIFYNVVAKHAAGQGLFSRGDANYRLTGAPADEGIAIVNVLMAGLGGFNTSWEKSVNHLLLWNITQVENNFNMVDDPTGTPTYVSNLSIRNCVVRSAGLLPTGGVASAIIDNNHFISSSRTYGTNATHSDMLNELFRDSANGDYRPRIGSVLDGRVSNRLSPADAVGTTRGARSSLGALDAGAAN